MLNEDEIILINLSKFILHFFYTVLKGKFSVPKKFISIKCQWIVFILFVNDYLFHRKTANVHVGCLQNIPR